MKLPILVSFLIVIGLSDGTWTKIGQAFELSKEARDIDWTLPFVPLENEEKKIQESFSLYYRSQRSNRIYSENPITRHSIRHARKYYRSVNSSMYLQKTWPIKKEAVIEGDLLLGGLMMVHEREDSITCGPVMPQGGIQALEAMLYTLDRLNINEGIIPGVKIGAHILDDCDKDTYGLEMAVDFIKESPTYNINHTECSLINPFLKQSIRSSSLETYVHVVFSTGILISSKCIIVKKEIDTIITPNSTMRRVNLQPLTIKGWALGCERT
ncbi:metabotropic glutamate receptor 2-like isoform X2 [Vespula maculifrons]|uniref:Metabotropic glutamate receptor 2-like isoform X2 n=1 Tax=Vespula maculifrons TaxID=7453 RepID=A0ABD2D0G9_VESMC